jgi:hypothetical protein
VHPAMAIGEFWDAWPASPASLFASEALANQMGTRGKVATFVNALGLNLACYFWPATTAEPKAVVQLCHGNGAFVMEYLRTQVSSACGYLMPLQLSDVTCIGCGSAAARLMIEILHAHNLQGAGRPLVYSGSWIKRLNNAGISVAGFDMQGCGFSEGLRGLRSFFESFEDIIADALQFRR